MAVYDYVEPTSRVEHGGGGMESWCSPDGIPEAIRRSMRILATHRALFGRPVHGRGAARTMSETDIARVVEVFETSRAGWALVGGHAIGLVTEPRATADFDFIVEGAKLSKVTRELTRVFGELGENDIGAAIQLKAIDVDLDVAHMGFVYETVSVELDRTLMLKLSGLVYPGAEHQFRELLEKLDRGDPISI